MMKRIARPIVNICLPETLSQTVSRVASCQIYRCFTSKSPTYSKEHNVSRIQARAPWDSDDDFESRFPLPDKEKEMELSKLQVHVNDLYKHGNYRKALDEAQALLTQTLDHLGDTHPATAAAHNNVGLLHKQLGQFDEARFSYRKALKCYKRTVGIDHHSYASALHNLGTLNRSQTHLDASLKITDRLTLMDESAEMLEQAYVIRRDELGEQHPHTVASRSSWGATLASRILHSYKQVGSGKYINVNNSATSIPELAWQVCEEHLRHALQTALSNPRGPTIAKKNKNRGSKIKPAANAVGGIQTLSAASAAQNLAVLLKARATIEVSESEKIAYLEEAHQLYNGIIAVRTQLLPEGHPDVYASKYSLAELLQIKGDEEAANAIRQEILDTYDPPVEEKQALNSEFGRAAKNNHEDH